MKNLKIIVPLFLLLGLALFYWYEWRPSQIRKECTESVEKQFHEGWLFGQQNYEKLGNRAFDEQSRLDGIGRAELRERCLERKGLK